MGALDYVEKIACLLECFQLQVKEFQTYSDLNNKDVWSNRKRSPELAGLGFYLLAEPY